jgi:hypothetical protein
MFGIKQERYQADKLDGWQAIKCLRQNKKGVELPNEPSCNNKENEIIHLS